MMEDVVLACSIEHVNDELVVRYRVSNRGTVDVAVMDRIYSVGIDGVREFLDDNVYVHFRDGTLHLTKASLPIPPGVFPARYEPTDASPLPAGGQHALTFRLAVPVKVRHPFEVSRYSGEVIASKRVLARQLTVSLGVVPLSGHRRLVSEHPAQPYVKTVMPSMDVLENQVVLSKSFEMDTPLTVLDYQAVPWG